MLGFMLGIILVILGVIGKIVKANAWFPVPNFVITVLFIGGGVVIAFLLVFIIVIKIFSAWKSRRPGHYLDF